MAQTVVQISGHIIDSLILPKVLDLIISLGAEFEILDIQIGHRRSDRSRARIKVEASSPDLLDRVCRTSHLQSNHLASEILILLADPHRQLS